LESANPDYNKFIDTFGTHYVTQVRMGAKFGLTSKFTEEGYSSLVKEGISVTAAASASAYGVTGTLESKTETEKQQASKYNSAREEYSIISVGSRPPKDNSGVSWAN
jgi:hypothetical protein